MADINNLVGMGYVKSAYGIRGWLNIKANTDSIDSLINYSNWYLCKGNVIEEVEILDGKVLSNTLRVRIKGIEDRESAKLLTGMEIKIPRNNFKSLDVNEYYWIDLVGIEVRNLRDIFIGRVISLIQAGYNSVLVIEGKEGKILIPFVSIYIINVDLINKKIISDWELDY